MGQRNIDSSFGATYWNQRVADNVSIPKLLLIVR
jgi:hypothetical protein